MSKKTNPNLPTIDPSELIIIGLDTDDDETHELFDERCMRELDENLVKNILVYGVINPITVREEAGKLYVVAGRQRVRAARKAKRLQGEAGEFEIKVPYTTHGAIGADRTRLAGIMVSENEQRAADDILTKAAKAARMQSLGASLDEVSNAFGRSTATIKLWLKLLEAHTDLHEAIRFEQIAVSAAHEIAKYPKNEQRQVLKELLKQADGSRITEAMAKAYRVAKGDSNASTGDKAAATAPVHDARSTDGRADGEDAAPLSAEAQALLDAGGQSPAPTPQKAPTPGKTRQAGIKRTWLRKALKTEAAEKLTDEQRGVLQWFATGIADKNTWYDDFQFDAEAEMEK